MSRHTPVATGTIRFAVHAFGTLPSTNQQARSLGGSGAPLGTVVTALRQSAGRGRHGRQWVSPPGNLYASFVLRPLVEARRAHEVGFVAALAVADAVDAAIPGEERATLKWPNDVLLGGAKISGILAEWVDDNALVLGIGLNVASAPAGLAYEATSLAAAGSVVTASGALLTLCDRLAAWLQCWEEHGFGPVREAWLARGPTHGAALVLQEGRLQGTFAGLDADGALLLLSDGVLRRVINP